MSVRDFVPEAQRLVLAELAAADFGDWRARLGRSHAAIHARRLADEAKAEPPHSLDEADRP